MLGIVENIQRRPALDNRSTMHDGDGVADLHGDAQVVGDEQHAQLELLLDAGKQRKHLSLHRDIERRDRLVGDQKMRSMERARAMQIRWRWPPENSCGKRSSASAVQADLLDKLSRPLKC